MNLSELTTFVRKRIGSPSVADVSDGNIIGHINDAYQEIFNKYKFKRRRTRLRFTTVSGKDKIDVSAVTDVIYKVWDRTNGRELTKVGTNTLATQDYDTAGTLPGKPLKWDYFETYLQILPVPDGAYVLEFVCKIQFTPLTGNTIPLIPTYWHRGIGILAAAMYYDDEGNDPVKATYHQNRFDKWVSDQPVEEHEETEAIDSGVEIPTLAAQMSTSRKPDGVAWDSLP
jgi:hypothetical protein